MLIDTILLIDDNPSDNFLHRLIIEETGVAREILDFARGTEALEYLKSRERTEPCLILLDINMPYMTGFEFLEEYNRLDLEKKKHVVVLMLTTSLHIEDQRKAATIPDIRGVLTKPLTKEEVIRIAQEHFDAMPNG